MSNKILPGIYVIFATIIVFLLAVIFMRKRITHGEIVVKETGAPTYLTVEPSQMDNRKLVPTGLVSNEDETDVIEIKYRIYVKGDLSRKLLVANIKSVTINDDPTLSHLITIIYNREQEVNKLDYYIMKIKLNRPANQEEYEKVQGSTIKIKLSFRIQK